MLTSLRSFTPAPRSRAPPSFFVAEPAHAATRQAVASEAARHGDIELLVGQQEVYDAVPHQTLAMLRYFTSNASSFLWIIKTDDDVFLRADAAHSMLLATARLFPTGSRIYTGWMVCIFLLSKTVSKGRVRISQNSF